MSTTYRVTCSDGQVRHADLFESRSDASKWAEWGHCCAADHAIEPVRDEAELVLEALGCDDHGPGCDGPFNCVCTSEVLR